MRSAALASAALFAALAALNATGVLHGVDAWAVRHLMPGLDAAHSSKPTLRDALTPFATPHAGGAERAAEVWLYPASAPLSALLVGLCCVALLRRGRREATLVWGAAFAVGVAVEVLVKDVVRRPALHAAGHHVVAFDSSLPSGHALRSAIVAAAVAYVWRRAGAVAAVWALSVFPLLVVAGWHTPSDVVAGIVLALTVVTAALARLGPR